MSVTLAKALSDFYHAAVVNGKPHTEALKPLREFIASSDEAKQEAVSHLVELSKLDASTGGQLARRCVVSYNKKVALEEALNGQFS